jgi:hypothetical protein
MISRPRVIGMSSPRTLAASPTRWAADVEKTGR